MAWSKKSENGVTVEEMLQEGKVLAVQSVTYIDPESGLEREGGYLYLEDTTNAGIRCVRVHGVYQPPVRKKDENGKAKIVGFGPHHMGPKAMGFYDAKTLKDTIKTLQGVLKQVTDIGDQVEVPKKAGKSNTAPPQVAPLMDLAKRFLSK